MQTSLDGEPNEVDDPCRAGLPRSKRSAGCLDLSNKDFACQDWEIFLTKHGLAD
jgi:hypothetical protein